MTGASRLIGDVFTNKIQITKIDAPTQSNGTSYGPGSSGQILKSNGTSVYWANDNNNTYSFTDKNVTLAWGTKSTIATVGGVDIHVTMPSNPNTNTDTLVKQTAKTDNVNYKLLGTASASPTSGHAAEAIYDANITINPSTHTITATNFAGNATTATTLQTAHTINGTSFNGSANITTANWGTARNISISDSDGTNTGAAVSVNGSAAVTLKLPVTIKANLSGNATTATTATKLGTSNIGATDRPIYLSGGTATQTTYRMSATNTVATTARAITENLETGNWYVNGTNSTDLYSQSDGVAYVEKYNDNWIHEIYGDYRTGQIAVRGKNSGTWQAWRKVLDSSNYTSYTVKKNGTGASGTWGISITGNAATATTASKLGTANKGSKTKPIYLSAGAPTECAVPSSGAWWSAVPQIQSDGVMEVGKYIDFHTTSNATTDYDVRITADTTGLTISGTTVGTFSGNLSGTATKATKDGSGNVITSTYVKKTGDTMTGNLTLNKITGSSANYGDTLPATGTEGQIFFKTGSVETKVDTFYPVGSIYMSVNSTNPGGLFGGTWERIQNCFLLAAGSNYAAGSTGGEATHTLTTNEMPSHTHGSKTLTGTMNPLAWAGSAAESGIVSGVQQHIDRYGPNGSNWGDRKYTIDATHEHNSVGSNQPHNNMPPYLAVYVWKRTA